MVQDLSIQGGLLAFRRSQQLTQTELAKKMGTCQSVISRLEKAEQSNVRLGTLRRMAKAMGKELIIGFR